MILLSKHVIRVVEALEFLGNGGVLRLEAGLLQYAESAALKMRRSHAQAKYFRVAVVLHFVDFELDVP